MTKRLCPFSDENLPECKTFVREEDINCDSAESKRIREVYEKTKKLLFAGANMRQDGNQNIPQTIPKVKFCEHCKKPYTTHDVKITCFVCTRAAKSTCSYCDNRLCRKCEMCCHICDQIFCKNCSFTVFTGNVDNQVVCYSCYT